MKLQKSTVRILACFLAVWMVAGLCACSLSAEQNTLATPVVRVNREGLAYWSEVSGANYYRYKINGGEEQSVFGRSVQLKEGETIIVKAVGDGEINLDSAYSAPVSYGTPTLVPLATPEVSIAGGVASWNAVEHATAYIYKINGGAEVSTSERSVTLRDGESIVVKAVGDGTTYCDSAYSSAVSASCKHADSNGDGKCDHCTMLVSVDINFFSFNDLHGTMLDTNDQPGLDEFSTMMELFYADESAIEFLLSAGDMWQGSLESSSNKGAMMTEWMNEMDFIAMTLGNHEFDWGVDAIAANEQLAEFPFLAINIRYNGQPLEYAQPSVVVEKGGVKVGVIGAIGNCLSSISGEFRDGLQFIVGNQLTALVQAEAKRLRTVEGCDIIVYSVHDSVNGYDEELSNKNSGKGYVDMVFEGHSHSYYSTRDKYGVPHLQSGSYNSGVGVISIEYDLLSDTFTIITAEIMNNDVYGEAEIEASELIMELFEAYFPGYDPFTDVLGYNFANRDDAELCQTVAELYYAYGLEHWREYDVVLGGGFLQTRQPNTLPIGDVLYSQLFALFPFDNDIVLVKVSGANLKRLFIENSRYKVAYANDLLARLDNTQEYYVVTDTYTSYYYKSALTEVARTPDFYARDLLKAYIQTGAWGAPASVQTVSISEALEIGEALADNATTTAYYFVSGTVVEIANTTYGNLYLSDGEAVIYVYGVYSRDGIRFDSMPDPPEVGDTVTLCGQIKRYVKNGTVTIELMSGRVYELISGE